MSEPAAVAANYIVFNIYNYGTVIIPQPSDGQNPLAQPEAANLPPAAAPAWIPTPDPVSPVIAEDDPFDDAMPFW